jgi:hypothetical protein
MDAEKDWRSGAGNDDGATRPSPPCTTPRYLFSRVMTLDTYDDRTAGAALENVENPTNSC